MAETRKKEKAIREKPPIFIIGCGGNGLGILTALLKKYQDAFDNDSSFLKKLPIELLAIDTLIKPEMRGPIRLSTEDYLALGPIQLDRFILNHYNDEPYIKEWFNPKQYAGLMTTGAMQIRAFGRLALYLKLFNVVAKLNEKLVAVQNKTHIYAEETEDTVYLYEAGASVQIHIVGSIAGGTGSGIMMDLAYLLRYLASSSITINAHLIMPEIVPDFQLRDSLYANSYAFLKELDNFNLKPELYSETSPITKYLRAKEEADGKSPIQTKNTDASIRTRPFDYIYLLSPYTKDSACLDRNFLHEIISEKIYLSSMNEIGDREFERVVNIQADVLYQKYTSKDIKLGKPCAYSSYGVSTLQVRKDAIRNKISEYVLTQIHQRLKEINKSNIELDPADQTLVEWRRAIKIEELDVKNFPRDNINKRKEAIKTLFKEMQTRIDTELEKRIPGIRGWFLKRIKASEEEKTQNTLRPVEPQIRIKEAKDIDLLDPSNPGVVQLLSADSLLKVNLISNLELYFFDRLEHYFLRISDEYRQIGNWLEDYIKELRKADKINDKDFDNILFYNFPGEKITDYIEKHGAGNKDAGEHANILAILEKYDPYLDDKERSTLDGIIGKIANEIWNKFASAWIKKEERSDQHQETRLTVNNFLKIMFADDYHKLDEILGAYVSIAAPCWRFNDHFTKYVKTISLIGCKKKNYLHERLQGWDFYGAKLEPTEMEEDPFEIPLIISQHGLPLAGYERTDQYRKSYYNMRQKFAGASQVFGRQFHIDKRWEEKDQIALVDPFEDVPDSYLRHINGQLFSFAWLLGIIKEKNSHFYMLLDEKEYDLNPDNIKSGVVEALDNFLIKLEEEEKLEEQILAGLASARKSDEFTNELNECVNNMIRYKVSLEKLELKPENDIKTMALLVQYLEAYIKSEFKMLSDLTSEIHRLIG